VHVKQTVFLLIFAEKLSM